MRKRGNICIALGGIILTIALLLALWNQYEDYKAKLSSENTMAQIMENINSSALQGVNNSEIPDPYDPEMTEKEIDGIKYVGYISIPKINRELPIISEWSYPNLKISPCRFSGSSKTDNLIIAGHNYRSHFGLLGKLKAGDEVILTDMDGARTVYQVVALDVLNPDALEDLMSEEYALTLFTCTYDTENRITVRCDKKQ